MRLEFAHQIIIDLLSSISDLSGRLSSLLLLSWDNFIHGLRQGGGRVNQGSRLGDFCCSPCILGSASRRSIDLVGLFESFEPCSNRLWLLGMVCIRQSFVILCGLDWLLRFCLYRRRSLDEVVSVASIVSHYVELARGQTTME